MVKRLLDVLISWYALSLLAPFMAAIAFLISREDRGPALYSGIRIGLGGVPFGMHKFRTMVPNADKLGGPSTPVDDPRITRIGAALRKYKLDELPQLLNVLLGDMSLVGPRPEVPAYVARYTEEERVLLSVRPGITDWASIRFRNEGEILKGSSDPEQAYWDKIRPGKVKLGMEYARDHSLGTDVRILLSTLAVLCGASVDRRAGAKTEAAA